LLVCFAGTRKLVCIERIREWEEDKTIEISGILATMKINMIPIISKNL